MIRDDSVSGASLQASQHRDGERYRYVVAVVLALVYMLNFLDRQILSILAEPIKLELGLSDTQLGLLTGLTFALFYTLFGIPVALIADRWNRVRVIAAACSLWSLFTAASGFAGSFLSLALARVGVGIGEAGCSPPAYSILSDYFPPERRGRALGIYVLGVPAGSLIGTVAAAWIAAHYGWRAAFISVGLLGLLAAPLILLLIREPQRGRYDSGGRAQPPGAALDAFRFFFRSPALVLNAIASGLTAFVSYGIINWTPAFLTRVQGMTLPQIGTYYGLVLAGSMVVASWLGAVFSDRLGARNAVYYPLLPGLGLVFMIPLLIGFTLASSWQMSLLLMIIPVVLTSTYLVPALALLQNRTPARYRATASSLLLFLINLTGLGCGPLLVGAISDWLAPVYGDRSLVYALQCLIPFALLAFAFQCASAWAIRKESRAVSTG
ncbi:MFS transporter [Hydrocarboniphaga sp.]|uniref:spinster family MFS transporter n=1 Tax=Hydrocarboniphaga sp. TaxID=2033016 RepID=UPI002ABC0DC9|nr:MFS transporter [Hydrocarboniphaga sp.]MDZ4079946.1 MFS transporter [Hydrocarboniphaga sp.]